LVYGISVVFVFIIAWTTITSTPVNRIPNDLERNNEYGYFISRGNSGITSGCYGQVHFFKKVSFLPFLEIRTEIVKCSDLPYECYIEDC
jgi:hypothetical protein